MRELIFDYLHGDTQYHKDYFTLEVIPQLKWFHQFWIPFFKKKQKQMAMKYWYSLSLRYNNIYVDNGSLILRTKLYYHNHNKKIVLDLNI